jgi:hypothetical protein
MAATAPAAETANVGTANPLGSKQVALAKSISDVLALSLKNA